ncbi:MAG: ABC transporter permease subunit [Candidatus Dormibacteria bacterium]
MWFRSVYLKSLRDYRVGILGWGVGMGATVAFTMVSVATLITTPEARAQLVSLAASFTWNASLVAVDTLGGYATFKVGMFMLVIAIWPILAASRLMRGDEESGSMDVILSLPQNRVRVAAERVLALWTALVAMALVIAAIVALAGQILGASFGPVDALAFGLNLALFCGVMGGLTLLASQFTQERATAAGIAAGLLVLFIVLDMVHRVIDGTTWISQLSPVYYYNLSKPLVPSFGTDPAGILVLGALALVLTGAAVWVFAQRDIGAPVPTPAWMHLPERRTATDVPLPAGEWSLRTVYLRSIRTMALPTMWWTLGIAGFAAWMIFAVQIIQQRLAEALAGDSVAKQVLTNVAGGGQFTDATFLTAMFAILPVMLMAFAVTQVNRWTNDGDEGRLDLVLATPQSRHSLLLGRFAALASGSLVIGLVTLLASSLASMTSGVPLDGGNLTAATLGMVPLALLVAAIGYLGGGWLRTSADTGLLSLLLAGWFFISYIGPDLKWPDVAERLSPFYYYGTPLVHGLSPVNISGLILMSAALLTLATWRFARRDL